MDTVFKFAMLVFLGVQGIQSYIILRQDTKVKELSQKVEVLEKKVGKLHNDVMSIIGDVP